MKGKEPRALMIAPIYPRLTGNGLSMRMALFVQALESICQLDVVVIPAAGQIASSDHFAASTRISIWEAEPETHFSLLLQIPDEANRLAAFERYGKPSMSSVISERVLDKIGALLAASHYDLIHIARSYMLPVLQACDGHAAISVDLDEDDHESVAMAAEFYRRGGAQGRAQWLDIEAKAFDHLIERARPRLEGCFVSSEDERRSLASRHPWLSLSVVPNGVAIGKSLSNATTDAPWVSSAILAIGRTCKVFDGLSRKSCRAFRRSRNVSFAFGWRAPMRLRPSWLWRRPRIEVLGEIGHISDFYRGITLALVPTRFGRGLRTKLVEAGAHATAFAATREGVAGFAFSDHGPAGWVADSAADFAEACLEALDDAAERQRRAMAGRDIAVRTYDRRRVISSLKAQFEARSPMPRRLSQRRKDVDPVSGQKLAPETIFEKTQGLNVSDVDDGYVIDDGKGDEVHFINSTAAIVYELCDGQTPLREIVQFIEFPIRPGRYVFR